MAARDQLCEKITIIDQWKMLVFKSDQTFTFFSNFSRMAKIRMNMIVVDLVIVYLEEENSSN